MLTVQDAKNKLNSTMEMAEGTHMIEFIWLKPATDLRLQPKSRLQDK